MSQVSVSEKVGAMAVVDELRHKQLVAEELLNLPERRKDVVESLSKYYDNKGVSVTPELLEQGVKEYFSKRLRFEEPEQSNFAKLASAVAITRRTWVPRGAIGLGLAGVLALGVSIGYDVYKFSVVEGLEQSAQQQNFKAQQLTSSIAGISQAAEALQLRNRQLGSPLAGVTAMLAQASKTGAEATDLLQFNIAIPLSFETAELVEEQVEKASSSIKNAEKLISSAKKHVDASTDLLGVAQELRSLKSSEQFETASRRDPVTLAALEAQANIRSAAEPTAVAAAASSLSRLKRLITEAELADTLSNQVDALKAELTSMKLTGPKDMIRVDAIVQAANEALRNLDTGAARKQLAVLNELLTLAKTTLTFQIVDRVGINSGVERQLNSSAPGQGKSWYVVVEALDQSGKVVPQEVTSSESGKTRVARYFGLRVSQEEYLRVRDDKLSDGKVDDKAVGSKPARSLTTVYNARVHPSHSIILDW